MKMNAAEINLIRSRTGLSLRESVDAWKKYGTAEAAIAALSVPGAVEEIWDTTAKLAKTRRGLNAIIARIEGRWDDPDLMSFGPLLPSSKEDCICIAKEALR